MMKRKSFALLTALIMTGLTLTSCGQAASPASPNDAADTTSIVQPPLSQADNISNVEMVDHNSDRKTLEVTQMSKPTSASRTAAKPAASAQESIAYNLNGVEFRMILVEGGTFTMGSDARARGRGTQVSNQAGEHQVTLSSYSIGEMEVTRALWNEVMNGSHRENDKNYPIASVTVPECRIFVERLNEKAHAAGIIPADLNFHMLTEAQWEFAAKGGNKSKGYTYAGSDSLSEVGWTSDDGDIHAVGQKKPNELGIYDMSGNVYEWVADYAAPYSTEAQTDPCNTTPTDNYIKRGGSFYYNDDYRFTSTYRYFYSSTDYTIGLRIGLS